MTKPWQKGYHLDHLKGLESWYEQYNAAAASPFSQIKKNNIADGLHKKTFSCVEIGERWAGGGLFSVLRFQTVAKRDSVINIYPGVPFAKKLTGDVTTTGLVMATRERDFSHAPVRDDSKLVYLFDFSKTNWVYTWSKDYALQSFLLANGFVLIGSKISSYGEIQFVFLRQAANDSRNRAILVPSYENISIRCVSGFSPVTKNLVDKIAAKIEDHRELFQNHYSNYNKDKAWSAFSLRGYKSDPTFMTKPIEMNDKWKEEHKNEVFEMQDTTLMEKFPEVYQLLAMTFNSSDVRYHRIRLMNLKPGDGELTRHTDQVDPDQGLAVGKLARFHFPIVTNRDVRFTVWDRLDNPHTHNMKVGECWVLDVRKPHAAINGGKEHRVHLVVDVEVTQDIIDKMFHFGIFGEKDSD